MSKKRNRATRRIRRMLEDWDWLQAYKRDYLNRPATAERIAAFKEMRLLLTEGT